RYLGGAPQAPPGQRRRPPLAQELRLGHAEPVRDRVQLLEVRAAVRLDVLDAAVGAAAVAEPHVGARLPPADQVACALGAPGLEGEVLAEEERLGLEGPLHAGLGE